jgi:hypothetical protein
MRFHNKVVFTLLLGVFVTIAAPWNVQAQIKSGVVNSRDQFLNQTSPPAGKGNPGPLPCNSKNNPKCDNVTPSKPGDNGVGNGVDPQPPGNPPINDGPGTGPGSPGAKSR